MKLLGHCIILVLTFLLCPGEASAAVQKPGAREIEQNREAFAEFVAVNFSLLEIDLREMAALYGYAIGREAVRVKKGTSRYFLWKDLIDFHERRFREMAERNYPEEPGAGMYASKVEYEKAVVTAFQRGYTGMEDRRLTVRTGVSPDGSPFFFSKPEMSTAHIITITLQHLRKTPLGRKVHDLNKRLKSIARDADSFPKGSDERFFLKKGFEELRRERTRVAQPLKGIKGTRIALYGEQARQRSGEIIDRVLRGMIKYPAFRPETMHALGRIIKLRCPKNRQVLISCYQSKK